MTLLETVIVMMLITMIHLNTTPRVRSNPFLIDHFKSEYLHDQILALAYKETRTLDSDWGIDLRFNPNGNINRPYRILINNTELNLRLGTGRFHEQGLLDD